MDDARSVTKYTCKVHTLSGGIPSLTITVRIKLLLFDSVLLPFSGRFQWIDFLRFGSKFESFTQ